MKLRFLLAACVVSAALGAIGTSCYSALAAMVFIFAGFTGVGITLAHDLARLNAGHDILVLPVRDRDYARAGLKLFLIGTGFTSLAYTCYWVAHVLVFPGEALGFWGIAQGSWRLFAFHLLVHLNVLALFWLLYWSTMARGHTLAASIALVAGIVYIIIEIGVMYPRGVLFLTLVLLVIAGAQAMAHVSCRYADMLRRLTFP